MNEKARILCVDDEPMVLEGLKRQLHSHYEVVTAIGGNAGIQTITEQTPFAIIISDMRMPGMDGATFLKNAKQLTPLSVRMLLTGQADLDSAIHAVNDGHIFRFLTKPCTPENLLKSLQAATEQYRLLTAEKVLLEQTLYGSMQTLMDVLSLANPDLFSQANRMKVNLKDLLLHLDIKNKWHIEIAVMLSHIGAITLPDEITQKLNKQEEFKPDEREMIERIPFVGEKLLSHIPRLESVREILLYQEKHFDGSGIPKDNRKGEQIPLGARILKILLDYDKLQSKGYDATYIFDTLRGRKGWYDESILEKTSMLYGKELKKHEIRELPVTELKVGMILIENLFNHNGVCLIRGGVEITNTLLARIQNIAKQSGVKEPVRVKLT